MSQELSIINSNELQSRIFTIRGLQVMLDSDLSTMYEVETKYLTRAVSRNIQRFPEQFRFQLTQDELENLRCQIGTSKNESLRFQNGTLETGRGKHRKYLPYVFTEQGVSMLSAVLRSETAIQVSIQIMDALKQAKERLAHNCARIRAFRGLRRFASLFPQRESFPFSLLNTLFILRDKKTRQRPCAQVYPWRVTFFYGAAK